MAIKPNQVRYITAKNAGIGAITNDADWFKNLFKKALCGSAQMTQYSATITEVVDGIATVKADSNCWYLSGQVVKISECSVPALNGEYAIIDGLLPLTFTIRLPDGVAAPTDGFKVVLSAGQWTYVDVNTYVTNFYPRDYVAGEDFFVSLNTEPYVGLTGTGKGRACDVTVYLDVDGTPVNVNYAPSALMTRGRPSCPMFSYDSINVDYRNWALYFDHESFYLFTTVQGLLSVTVETSQYGEAGYFLTSKQGVGAGQEMDNYGQHAAYRLRTLTAQSNINYYPDFVQAAFFSTYNPNELYSHIPKRERRVFGFPSSELAKMTHVSRIDYTYNLPVGYRNCVASVLPLSGVDGTACMPMPPDTLATSVKTSILLGGTSARSGGYPYHARQSIGKSYATINHPEVGIKLGYFPGLIGIGSNIHTKLPSPTQEILGDNNNPNILSVPVERYEDNTVLVGVCRGVSGAAQFPGTSNGSYGGNGGHWQGILVGGEWSSAE